MFQAPLAWNASKETSAPQQSHTHSGVCNSCISSTQYRVVLCGAALRAAQEGDELRNQSLSHFFSE